MLVEKSEGKKKGEGVDGGWRGLHMLLGKRGAAWGAELLQGGGQETGGHVSVVLPQGPAKLLGLGSSGRGQSGRAVVVS